MLAGSVPRGQCDTSDGTFRHILDVLDILGLVVAIADAPQDPGAEREGDQQQEPGDEVLDEICSLRGMLVLILGRPRLREYSPG